MSAGRSIIDELITTTTASLGGKRSLPYMDRKKYDQLQPEATESHGTKLNPKNLLLANIQPSEKVRSHREELLRMGCTKGKKE